MTDDELERRLVVLRASGDNGEAAAISHDLFGEVMWVVIAPEGTVTFYLADATREVERLVAGHFRGALDRGWVRQPLQVLASDMALLAPDKFAPNAVAEVVIANLSEGRKVQPWAGYVALVEYEQDSGPGSIGEWLGPTRMSDAWLGRVLEALAAAGAKPAGRT